MKLDNGVVKLHNGVMPRTQPTMTVQLTPCPDCNGRLVDQAFAPSTTDYARCTRCGHVFARADVIEVAPA